MDEKAIQLEKSEPTNYPLQTSKNVSSNLVLSVSSKIIVC
jgi:hypothetical protein